VETIALIRVANVLPCVQQVPSARERLDRELRRRSLPTMLEDEPDAYVPKLPLFACLEAVAHGAGIADLGSLALRGWRTSCLDRDLLERVRGGRTLGSRLAIFAALGRIEDTQLDLRVVAEGPVTRIVLGHGQPAGDDSLFGEWLQLAIMLGVVRDALGARSRPVEVTLRSSGMASREIRAALPGVRVIYGARFTSIVLHAGLLDEMFATTRLSPCSQSMGRSEQVLDALDSARLAPRLKMMLRSYLKDGYPPIGLAAALARTSVRSLQRELARSGVSYSELVQEVRFEQATAMLAKARIKVIDVALSLGYEDASHFSRAFKRVSGISPRQYRTQTAGL
jgi:AraC-like DNA-binding protein